MCVAASALPGSAAVSANAAYFLLSCRPGSAGVLAGSRRIFCKF
jgi:hypothetical protein